MFDVVSQDMCRGSSAWESARLKTESSHVQTLPSAPNNLNLRLFCNIGHKLQHYVRSARRVMRYERRNVPLIDFVGKSKIMVEAKKLMPNSGLRPVSGCVKSLFIC